MADEVNAQKTLSKKRDKVLLDKKKELKICNDKLALYKSTNSTEGTSQVVAELESVKDELNICLNNPYVITLDECDAEKSGVLKFLDNQNNKDWCHSYSSSIPYSSSVLCSVDYLGKSADSLSGGSFWQDTHADVKFYVSGALTVAAVVAIGGLGFAGYTYLFPVVTDNADLNREVQMLTEISLEYSERIVDLTVNNIKGKAFIEISQYVPARGYGKAFETITKAMYNSPQEAIEVISGLNFRTKTGVIEGLQGLEDVMSYLTQAEGAAEMLGNVADATAE